MNRNARWSFAQTLVVSLALCPAVQAQDCAPSCHDACDRCEENCGDCLGTWIDNTQVWLGGESYKGLGETTQLPGFQTGFMASAGPVAGFNTGFGLGDSRVRGQLGASFGLYDLKGRDTTQASSLETQYYITAGFYQRSDVSAGENVSWAIVYDQFFGHNWGMAANELAVGQIRSLVGYAVTDWMEFGVWSTIHTNTTGTSFGPFRAMNQGNFYVKNSYDFGGTTMFYAGAVDPADVASWQLGFLGVAPLNDRLSLYGNYVYSFPGSATGVVGSNEYLWAFSAGLAYSFGGKAVARNISGQQGLPLLPVANNGSLLITN